MSELCRRQIIRQQQIMKKGALTVLIALLPLAAIAQTPSINEDGKKIEKEKMETKDYLPEVHGTIRAKYEYQTTMGAGRFEVRNARVSVTGNVLPSVAYKAEIDLSDEGQIKMLDAYARLFPTKGLTVTAGQMRVPFTIDAHRSPHQQYFPNRSFIAKQVGNVRDVGFTVGYTLPTDVPITVEGGLFNGSGLTNQKEWHKEVNYSAKAQFLFTKGLNLTLSVQSIQPEEVRMQSYDIGAYYETGRFHIEGEYLYKQYSGNAFKDVHAVNTFINYDLPLRKVFNKMSFLLRYDMMTDQSDAKTADEETGRFVNCIFVYNFGVVMTDEEKKLLSTFEARLRHLIYLHDELKRENAELKQLLEAKEEEYGKVQAEYRELELNYTNLKTATTISLNGSDVKETKLRLSKLVREVDKCIALLNE